MVPARSTCYEEKQKKKQGQLLSSSQCAKLSATPRRLSVVDILSQAEDTIGTVMCVATWASDGLKTTTFEHLLNMRINDKSSVPTETLSVSLTIPSKTSACNVGCHAQSTFRSRPENDILMCANKPRGAEGVLGSTRIVSLSIAMSCSPAAVARNTRTCGNGWGPLKNGICSRHQRCDDHKRHMPWAAC